LVIRLFRITYQYSLAIEFGRYPDRMPKDIERHKPTCQQVIYQPFPTLRSSQYSVYPKRFTQCTL
jgi:hypothetical protein